MDGYFTDNLSLILIEIEFPLRKLKAINLLSDNKTDYYSFELALVFFIKSERTKVN